MSGWKIPFELGLWALVSGGSLALHPSYPGFAVNDHKEGILYTESVVVRRSC